MDNNGWIKLHRKLHDSDFWLQEKFTKAQAWVDLLMLANHKDGFIRKRGIRVNLKRGDIGWSELQLAKRWKWSRGKVRRFLSELCSKNERKMVQQTVHQNSNVTSCYHIINYDRYQSGDTADGTPNGHQTVHQTDTKRYRNKNEKNDKNEKNIYTDDFLQFWKLYPKKQGKGAAWKSWKRIKKANGVFETILTSVEDHKKSDQWKKDNGQYIPNPSTWLNQCRWEDELKPFDPWEHV